jgi:tetratricopeptide (TPR) repeat protein
MESYTTRDVARLLGLSEAQVRSQARAGFLTLERGPRNSYRFSFRDLVILRTARELAGARVPPRRINHALRNLARHLPSGRVLTELSISADGARVMARDAAALWNAESEQLQIDFSAAATTLPPDGAAWELAERQQDRQDCLTAPQWFDRGESLEDVDPREAMRAYTQAVALDPALADAHVNLGRLLQLAGRPSEAIEHYRRALQARRDPVAAFNLGTALEELGRWTPAIAAYEMAIHLDRSFADPHFNLSRLYQLMGRPDTAIRYLREYQRLE